MNKIFIAAAVLGLGASAVLADTSELTFDPAKLCDWQKANNNMNVEECLKLEDEAKAAMVKLETEAEQARKDECVAEAKNFSGDSGFASYTVYTECLKKGPGSL